MDNFTGRNILPDHGLFCQDFSRIEHLNLLNSGSSVGELKLYECPNFAHFQIHQELVRFHCLLILGGRRGSCSIAC